MPRPSHKRVGRKGAAAIFLVPLLFATTPVLQAGAAPAAAVQADESRVAAMRAYLDAARDQWRFQGAVIVARKGKPVIELGIGLADLRTDAPDTPATKFMIGSVGKTITAAAILQLEEAGQLRLTDAVSTHLPDYPAATGSRITIHQLLSHTAGIPEAALDPRRTAEMSRPVGPAELLALFKDRPLDFEPGSKYQYSNSGYVILGLIIEKLSGKSYYDYVEERILRPLGMRSTGYAEKGAEPPEFARGFSEALDGSLRPAPFIHPSWGYAAGAFSSTVGDMLAWDRGLASGKVLSPASIEKMFRPVMDSYGYGWLVRETFGRKGQFHGGGLPGFSAWIERWPDDDAFVAVLANIVTAPTGEIGRSLAAALFGERYAMPAARTAAVVDPKLLDDYVGSFRIDAETVRDIVREGNALFVSRNGGRRVPILPFEKDGFFFPGDKGTFLRFTRDEAGKVNGHIFHQLGVDERAVKSGGSIHNPRFR
jgi:CubicO group peptidase (beta-lactamase class C family)